MGERKAGSLEVRGSTPLVSTLLFLAEAHLLGFLIAMNLALGVAALLHGLEMGGDFPMVERDTNTCRCRHTMDCTLD